MQQPSHDVSTAEQIAGFVLTAIATVIAVLQFLPGARRRRHEKELARIRKLVEEAFAMELKRGEHTKVVADDLTLRVDDLDEKMAHNAELLEQIPQLILGQQRIEKDVGELRGDVKLILQQLGQVQGVRSVFPPLAP